MPKRKRLSASQKAQIVLEAIREEKSVSQIAAKTVSIRIKSTSGKSKPWKTLRNFLKMTAKASVFAKLNMKDNSTNYMPRLGD